MDVNGSKGPDDALRNGVRIELLDGSAADALVASAPSMGSPPPPAGADGDPASPEGFSDIANASRLAGRCAGTLKFCDAMGWLHYDGRRWALDRRDRIIEMAKEVALANVAAAEAMAPVLSEKEGKALLAAARRCLQEPRIRAMVTLAQSDPRVRVGAEELDTDPFALNVLNGTLDLRTGELRPHRPEDLITKVAPVDHDPAATCPTWDAFLRRILDGNGRLIAFLQEAVGYALTGDTSEQVIFLLHGTGANGKSTLLETLTDMLGDYWAKMNAETLQDQMRSAGAASEDVAKLAGARFVTSVEIPPGRPLNTALVKELTGGDTVQARFLYRPFFSFRPRFKAFLAMNQKPTIRDPTEGIWRRIRQIPFTVTIPPGERDKKLPEKLRAEMPGILAWAVRGCLSWQRNGLSTPEEVVAATESYRAEQDALAAFLADCCVVAPGLEVATKDLLKAYKEWCEASGEEPLSATAFGKRLSERGFPSGRAHGGRVRRGLALASSVPSGPPSSPGQAGGVTGCPEGAEGGDSRDFPEMSDSSDDFETVEV